MNIIRKDKKAAQTFQVEIVETLSTIVEVNAEDEQSALLKAQEMYRNEQVVLYPDDFIDTKFIVFQ
ncbi:DpnD/PcfM family protein [Psychrobacter sp. APC 3281]|uniref:DpnD/PcfM family protein n=1 Tax=Psychrobacter sp. APC 3281 TaxID=3035190 RepID=UPI0025B46250|nr:DpnD/PcfM family protein [Psychrobacter sp. APC 3281]MDN3447588.1 DpnD/PcfM family protein [Psychrobacter sp. APC 3281]